MRKVVHFVVFVSLFLFSKSSAQSVGALAGTFDVSDLGAATYTIPITVPPGVNGLQPSLSLSYNSQAGNGIMGMGWSLGGGSAIARVPNGIYHDRNVKGIDLSDIDKFALDGARLILVDGTYGQPFSVYKTEVESYRRVTALGSLGSGPQSFTVRDQNEMLYEYGLSSQSRFSFSITGEPSVWLLEKVTDPYGNYITYNYLNPPSYFNVPKEEPRLASITYTGNNMGDAPASLISFQYESRPDPSFVYLAGHKITQSYRLTSIHVLQKGETFDFVPIGSYHMEYAHDFYTHLIKVTQKGHEIYGTPEAFKPTQFEYGTEVTSALVQSFAANGSGASYDDIITGDFNGDGLSDFIRTPKYYDSPNNTNTWDLFLNTGNGYELAQTTDLPTPTSTSVFGKEFVGISTFKRNTTATGFFDFNGDGKDDYFLRDVEDISMLPWGPTLKFDAYNIYISDGSGLGLLSKEIVPHVGGSVLADRFNPTHPLVGDFDGDGKTEILVLDGSMYSYSYSYNFLIGEEYLQDNGTYLLPTQLHNMPFDAKHIEEVGNGGVRLFVVDIDGDGRSEVLTIWSRPNMTPVAAVFRLNVTFDDNNKPVVGDPAFVLVAQGTFPTLYHNIFLGDFNGDGITDFLTWKDSEGWRIGYGNGKGYVDEIVAAPVMNKPNVGGGTTRPILIADFNGDGKSDIYDYTPDFSAYNWGTPHSPNVHYSKGNHVFETKNYAVGSANLAHLLEFCAIGDYDGDGNADLFYKEHSMFSMTNVSFKANEKRHLLHKATNGLGDETKVTYAPLTDPTFYQKGATVYNYPFVKRTLPIKVVSIVGHDNGIDKMGNDVHYWYKGLKFNVHGKGIVGFDELGKHDVSTQTTVTKNFGLDLQFAIAYPLSVWTYQGSSLVSKSEYDFQLHDFGNKRIFPYTTQESTHDYLNGSLLQSHYYYSDDNFIIGKPSKVETFKGSLEWSVEEFTYPHYLTVGANIARPTHIKVSQHRAGMPAYVRETNYNYDYATDRLTSIVSDPGTSNQVTTSYTYDSYGNMATKSVAASGLSLRWEQYIYDPSRRFLVQAINPSFPNVVSIKNYHHLTGTLTSETQADGYVTSYSYDGFGRVRTQSDNEGKVFEYDYQWSAGDPYGHGSVYSLTEWPNFVSPSTKYFDRKGRTVRSKGADFSSGVVLSDVVYNNKGQVLKESAPYIEWDAPKWTQYQYDVYGRIVQEVRPEANFQTSYTTNYIGLLTVVTNANTGQQKKTQFDQAGKVRFSEDEGGRVNFTYHSNGIQKTSILDYAGVVKENICDGFGRVIESQDPNFGSYTYVYNALDELVSQTDPKGKNFTFLYDGMGNMVQKTGPEGDYYYTYYAGTGPNCGKMTIAEGPQSTLTYSYGIGDQVVSLTRQHTGSGRTFLTQYGYDAFGRNNSITYPNGTAISYRYNPISGHRVEIVKGNDPFVSDPEVIYSIRYKNALGQTTSAMQNFTYRSWAPTIPESLPGTIRSYQIYDGNDMLAEQKSIIGFNTHLKRYTYGINSASGNLEWRRDEKYGLSESFSFDDLDRLVQIDNDNGSEQLTYDDRGNILEKSDVGTFTYDVANRVSEITPYANIADDNQELSYYSFNKVKSIEEGTWKARFDYWPSEQRSAMEVYKKNILQTTTYYAGDYEEEVDSINGTVKQRCYIYSPDGDMVAVIETVGVTEQVFYILTDHLGSITHVVDGSGIILEERAYDAWGRLRDPQTWAAYPANIALGQPLYRFDRGYTGHEHLPQFGIINMNGRLYDPVLGRMFSPDPYIMGEHNTQGYNRYTYALNNPLKYTDPTGEYLNIILGAIMGGISGYMMADAAGLKGKFWYALAGAAIGAASGGASMAITQAGGSALVAGAASGAIAGAGYGGLSAGMTGGNVAAGVIFGGLLGGVTGVLSAWSPFGTTWYGNTAYGALFGAGTGAANAAINGQDIGRGALWGGAIGGAIGFATSEHSINAIRGQGFRSNNAVLQKYVAAGNQQGALDYFGFKGIYDPSPQNTGYTESSSGYFGKFDVSTGIIHYGDHAFSSYHNLKSTYYKEMFHYNRMQKGIPLKKYYSDFPNIDHTLYYPEERLGFIHQYKNQGLYTSYTVNSVNHIGYYAVQCQMNEYMTPWWHFIYKISRRW